jgi:hypothetical protein
MIENVGLTLVYLLCIVCLWVAICEINEDLKN